MAEYCTHCSHHRSNASSLTGSNQESDVMSSSISASLQSIDLAQQGNHVTEGMARLSVSQTSQNMNDEDGRDVLPRKDDEKDYDVFLIGIEGDDLVYKLQDFLKRFVRGPGDRELKVCLEEDFYPQTTERFGLLELGLNKCYCMFILFSSFRDQQQWLDSSKLWYRFTQSQSLISHIMNSTQIVVIKEDESSVVEGFFNGFVEFTLSRMLNGRSLRSCDIREIMDQGAINLQEYDRLGKIFIHDVNYSARPMSNVAVEENLQKQPSAKVQRIGAVFHQLAGFIDPENGLLTSLYSRQLLDTREYERLKKAMKTNSHIEVNEELLKKIMCMNDEKIEQFVEALHETNQSHIVVFLNNQA